MRKLRHREGLAHGRRVLGSGPASGCQHQPLGGPGPGAFLPQGLSPLAVTLEGGQWFLPPPLRLEPGREDGSGKGGGWEGMSETWGDGGQKHQRRKIPLGN